MTEKCFRVEARSAAGLGRDYGDAHPGWPGVGVRFADPKSNTT